MRAHDRLLAPRAAAVAAGVGLALCVTVAWFASTAQRGFGRLAVSNVTFTNEQGIRVRGKLFRPQSQARDRLPAVVYVHGYQNTRETSDPYCIELARRQIVALCIDAIGRGNSGFPGDIRDPGFDETDGARAAISFLKGLDSVDPAAIGVAGHSLGGEKAYRVALADPTVRAVSFSGFGFSEEATEDRPKNMLMLLGQHDEYRRRMVGTDDPRGEWMRSAVVRGAFPAEDPRAGQTYGAFDDGSARRVVLLETTHSALSHDERAVAEVTRWFVRALDAPPTKTEDQIWPLKEWATLLLTIVGIWLILPVGQLLSDLPVFARSAPTGAAGDDGRRHPTERAATRLGRLFVFPLVAAALYLPLVLVLFAVHLYVVPLDGPFPMMIANGIVGWLCGVGLIGLALLYRWGRRRSPRRLFELGLSFRSDRFALRPRALARALGLGLLSFAIVYGVAHGVEALFNVDYRFRFPVASDLTLERASLMPRYLPFLFVGTLAAAVFLAGPARHDRRAGALRLLAERCLAGWALLVLPLLLLAAIQYVPLLLGGPVVFSGPGGVLATFVINLGQIAGMVALIVPVLVGFQTITGRPYAGAFASAALLTWFFCSSQVVAQIPV